MTQLLHRLATQPWEHLAAILLAILGAALTTLAYTAWSGQK